MNRKRIALLTLIGVAGLGVAACNDGSGYSGVAVGSGPGGFYVYDRYRRSYRWNNDQQRYWQGRGDSYWRGRPGGGAPGARPPSPRPNWHDFRGGPRGGGNHGGRHP